MNSGKFDIVVACDLARGIGLDNKLPWQLPTDMKYFRELTRGNAATGYENCVIMGRNTWDSIPAKRRPLPDRRNIILTRKPQEVNDSHSQSANQQLIETRSSLPDALQSAFSQSSSSSEHGAGGGRCFVIGGAKVYEQAIVHEDCGRLYLTQINAKFDCDVFFPPYEEMFVLLSETEVQEENGLTFSFKVYENQSRKLLQK